MPFDSRPTMSNPDEVLLRDPHENIIFVASVILNLVLVGGAIVLIILGTEFLEQVPYIGKYGTEMRAIALALLAVPFTLPLLRNIRLARVRGSSVRLSEDQVPEIFDILKQHCEKLGIDELPELYLTDNGISEASCSYSAWQVDYIVLATDYIDSHITDSLDIISFLLGSEIGRIRLGHTGFFDDLLLSFISKVPVLRNPLCNLRTYSRDRYGAYLAPQGFSGLVIQAAGRRPLRTINFEDFRHQAVKYGGLWAEVVVFHEQHPAVHLRVRKLLEAGYFKNETIEASSSEQGNPAKRLDVIS